jgi:hypothetical protein
MVRPTLMVHECTRLHRHRGKRPPSLNPPPAGTGAVAPNEASAAGTGAIDTATAAIPTIRHR